MRDLKDIEVHWKINFSKEYHIINHEAKKGFQFRFSWNVFQRGLGLNDISDLVFCAIFKMNAFDRKLFKSVIDVINNKNEILEIVKNSIANLVLITKEVFFAS